MSETKTQKWTPGPWVISEHDSDGSISYWIEAPEGGDDHNPVDWEWAILNKANAHLIAAAPAMAEALEDMLAGWKYIRMHHGDLFGVGWDRAQSKAEAALALSRGEKPE